MSVLDLLLSTPGPRGRMGLPALLLGAPGTGKTALVEARAHALGLTVETVLLSIREPADIAGYPVVSGDGTLALAPPAWARRLNAACEQGAGALLFLDELTCAAPALQAAALRILAEGVVGEVRLHPRVRILAAGNPADLAAGGGILAAATANRLLHVQWASPTGEAWGAWLAEQAAPPDAAPAWRDAWERVRSAVVALHTRAPAGVHVALCDVPQDEAARGGAWPSPRSWELAARGLAGVQASGLAADSGAALSVLVAALGEGTARAAWGYLSRLDLPDPAEVLAGRATVPTDRPDRAYASLGAVVALATRRPIRAEGARAADPLALEQRVRGLEVARAVALVQRDVAFALAGSLVSESGALFAAPALVERVTSALAGPLAEIGRLVRTARVEGRARS